MTNFMFLGSLMKCVYVNICKATGEGLDKCCGVKSARRKWKYSSKVQGSKMFAVVKYSS